MYIERGEMETGGNEVARKDSLKARDGRVGDEPIRCSRLLWLQKIICIQGVILEHRIPVASSAYKTVCHDRVCLSECKFLSYILRDKHVDT